MNDLASRVSTEFLPGTLSIRSYVGTLTEQLANVEALKKGNRSLPEAILEHFQLTDPEISPAWVDVCCEAVVYSRHHDRIINCAGPVAISDQEPPLLEIDECGSCFMRVVDVLHVFQLHPYI